MAIIIGVAMPNLARASAIGGISSNASFMKMNEPAQMQTIVPAMATGTMFLLEVVVLPVPKSS